MLTSIVSLLLLLFPLFAGMALLLLLGTEHDHIRIIIVIIFYEMHYRDMSRLAMK